MSKKKNRHAVALGRRGGKAGKGSPARKRAARNAAKMRWDKWRAKRLASIGKKYTPSLK